MIESRQEIRRAVVLHVHPVDHLLVVPPLHVLHPVQIKIDAAKIYLHAAAPAIAMVQLATSARVVKSAIHAGFVQRHKIAINRESVRASSSQIFRMM
jgi:hypothetical protein